MTKERRSVRGNIHKSKPIVKDGKLIGIQYFFRFGNKILPLIFQSRKQKNYFVELCGRFEAITLKGMMNHDTGFFEVGIMKIGDTAEKKYQTERLHKIRSNNEFMEDQRNKNSVLTGHQRSADYSMVKSEQRIAELKSLENRTKQIDKNFKK